MMRDFILLVFLASVVVAETERTALKEAKENYKTQMVYQGAYPEEAKELKQELQKEEAKIKEEFAAPAAPAAPALLLAEGAATPAQEKRDLKEAKENYKMQMVYQGAYPEEAKENYKTQMA